MFIVDASSPHPTHNLTIISWDQACYWPYSTGVSPGLSVVSGGQGVFVNVFWMIECWGSLFSVPCRTPLILLFPIITTKFRRCICIWAYFPMEINWLNTCFPPKLSAVPYRDLSFRKAMFSLSTVRPSIQSLILEKLCSHARFFCPGKAWVRAELPYHKENLSSNPGRKLL